MPSKTIKTVKQGALIISIKLYSDGRYGFDYNPPGEPRKQVRHWNQSDAEAKAKDLLGIAVGGRIERLNIGEDEFIEYLRWKEQKRPGIKIPDLVKDFLEMKKSRDRSKKHQDSLKYRLEPFSRKFKGLLTDLTRKGVEGWMDEQGWQPRSWNNTLDAIKSLHGFARDEGYLNGDKTPVERMERKEIKSNILTYTPAELTAFMSVLPPEWQVVIALGAFAGLRPEEAAPETTTNKPGLQWENILWHKNKIDVPAEVSKTRQRRFIPMNDALLSWLIPLKKKSGRIAPKKGRIYWNMKIWEEKSSVTWKTDGLRHSYASYRLAETKDMAALALEMGNSPAMIFKHYLDLKHEDEAIEWFKIRSKLLPANVVQMSA